jgi:transcriptional regulator with XRE-family HTH domain
MNFNIHYIVYTQQDSLIEVLKMTTFPFIIHWLDMSVFSERLRLLREARQLTQARLATLLDVDPRVYNRWEKGSATPQFDTIIHIADILKISLDELAGRSPSITEPKIHNAELLNLYQQVDSLPDAEQQALILVIDGLVKKSQMEKIVGKRTNKR